MQHRLTQVSLSGLQGVFQDDKWIPTSYLLRLQSNVSERLASEKYMSMHPSLHILT